MADTNHFETLTIGQIALEYISDGFFGKSVGNSMLQLYPALDGVQEAAMIVVQ